MLAVALLALLGALAVVSRWHKSALLQQGISPTDREVAVSTSVDRGPGSLREALFRADGMPGSVRVVIRVKQVVLEGPLPPLVNPHGISIVVAALGAEIDGHALRNAPVFDVDAENVSITGLTVRNCPGPGILVRAGKFHLASSTIASCDVGVDVAEGVDAVSLEHNSFAGNRVGVRFAAGSRASMVVGNKFSADAAAGIWAVRAKAGARDAASIVVRDNQFDDDRIGVVAGNIAMLLDRNVLNNAREAAIHVIGAGASVRGNRISGSAAMGIVAENAVEVTITDNEIDHAVAYGIMVKGSEDLLVQGNQVHNCGYGMAFVLGDARHPSTAVENTIFGVKYHGFDVVGASPILRRNRFMQEGSTPLHVENYQPPGGHIIYSRPFLEGNNWSGGSGASAAIVPAHSSAPVTGH